VTTAQSALVFANAITLTASVTLSTGSGVGNISLGTVNGNFGLQLTAGTGDITLGSAIGSTTRIGAFVVNSCTNLIVNDLSAASINITETGGTVTFNGNLNTNTASGITLTVHDIVRVGSITATSGGPLTTVFTGTITGSTTNPITVGSASTTSSGAGVVNFQGSLTTTTGGITYNTPITLIGPATF